ncbi:Ig-like domain-containing protein [Amycolatopsis lurida]
MAKEDSFMANAMKRVAKTVGRTVAIATVSTALVGGALGTSLASGEELNANLDKVAPLDSGPGTPASMKFYSSAAGGEVQPGQTVRVGVTWDAWRVWDTFQSSNQSGTTFSLAQDFARLLGSTTTKVRINGQECNDYATSNGGKAIANSQHDETSYQLVDFVGLADQVLSLVNQLGESITQTELLKIFTGSKLGGYCDFQVPPVNDGKITVNGIVERTNLIFLRENNQGTAYLKVDQTRMPAKPTVDGEYELQRPKGGVITGTGTPGAIVYPKIGGRTYSGSVKVKDDGTYSLTLPEEAYKPGKSESLVVLSRNSGGGGVAESDAHNLKWEAGSPLTRPEITDPQGDTVSAGERLTVSGSDGSKVTPVDEQGNPVGTEAVVENGTAQVTLNKDVKPGTKIRIQAKDVSGSAEPLYSDPKTVKGDTPPEPKPVYQTETPAAAPGQESQLTFAIEPPNGDLASIAGKKITVTAPDGYTFPQNLNATAAAGDKGNKNNGEFEWLGDDATVSSDGKTVTIVFPDLETVKRLIGDFKSVKIGISVKSTVDANATPGEKTGGKVTVDGIGTTELKGKVN